MGYRFYPLSFDMQLVQEKFANESDFLKCMALYKQGFERFLSRFIPFEQIDSFIEKQGVFIPKVDDLESNFYHKFSTLGSDYIYLRNNFHVENLDIDDIMDLFTRESIPVSFYERTFKKVVFEKGDVSFFGIPCDETKALSQSLVFEFAFKQTECQTLEQLNSIRKIRDQVFQVLEDANQKELKIATSYLTYNMIPNIFKGEEKERNRG